MVQNGNLKISGRPTSIYELDFVGRKLKCEKEPNFLKKNSDAARAAKPTANFIKGQHISHFLSHSTEVFLEGLNRGKLQQQKNSSNDNSFFLPSAMGVILHRG